MTVEPATRDDIAGYFGMMLPMSVRAYVVKDNNKIIAIGGVFKDSGKSYLFGEITDEMREKYPVALYKTARKILSKQTGEVIAMPQQGIDAAKRFLQRLGFKDTDGGLMSWHNY